MTGSVGGIILAGGLSRRMGGGDKSLMPLAGMPMIGHVIARLRPQCEALAINANGDASRFADFALPVVPDSIEGFAGPLAGILAGLDWAASHTGMTHIATAAADTPFLPEDLVSSLLEANAGSHETITMARSDGRRHPVFGLWPVALRDDLRQWMDGTDTYKVLAFVDRHKNRMIDFSQVHIGKERIDPFFNANTPDDLQWAEKLASEAV